METFLLEHGLPALFFLSLLAATLLPLGSEWLLAALILQGLPIVQVVTVAAAGNILGAYITYAMGRWGSDFFVKNLLRMDAQLTERAMEQYQRYGTLSLLLAWMPVIGDPLCLTAGIMRLHPLLFLIPVSIGKVGRYLFITMLSSAAL